MQPATSYRSITAQELARRLGGADQPFVLDVRTVEEHAEASIAGSHNIPLDELAGRLDELPGDREIVVHCAVGQRSAQAAAFLSAMGYGPVADLAGGLAQWQTVYDEAEVALGEAAGVVQVRRRAKGCLSYVVGAAGEALVVDPSLDLAVYVDTAARRGWRITSIVDTHLHADHLSGARALAGATGATMRLNPLDDFDFPYAPIGDGERLTLGRDRELSVVASQAPGHTEGSTTYLVGDRVLLSGDTLFVDGVGRPDLAECAVEYARNLHHSLHHCILALPDDTLVLPAHYGEAVTVRPGVPVAATLGELRRILEPLALDEAAFVAWASSRANPRPPNYVEIVRANRGRTLIDTVDLRHLELGPNRCSA